MPRVAILCEYASLNGGERSMLATIQLVQAAGFEPHVVCPATGQLADALDDRSIARAAFSFAKAGLGEHALIRLRERLHQLLQRLRPDILHANSVSMSRLSGPVAVNSCIASIGHLRDMIGVNRTMVKDLSCHRRLLAVSDATRQWYIDRTVNATQFETCYNGVDVDEFEPHPSSCRLHRELGIERDRPLIGAIGQIGLRKGMDVLLAAAARVVTHRYQPHFVIVGQRYSQKDESRRFEQRLHDVAARPPLAGRVHFLGYRSDVPQILNDLTILVHTAHQEPLGRVLLEAGAAGRPIIATDVGGTREIFPSECAAARLIPRNDPDAAAHAIAQLLDAPEQRRALSDNARLRITTTFSAPAAAHRLVGHYRWTLSPM